MLLKWSDPTQLIKANDLIHIGCVFLRNKSIGDKKIQSIRELQRQRCKKLQRHE
jgi:hypothetical protein